MGWHTLSEARAALADLARSLAARNANGVNAANEAAALLGELELLDRRIEASSETHRRAEHDFATRAVDELRLAATDPKIAEWFRANPNVVPGNITSASNDPTGQFAQSTIEIRVDVSAFYGTAYRLLAVLRRVPGFEAVRCREITIVRNKLLEHTNEKEGRGPMWSFGFEHVKGPVLAPIWRGGERPAHQDAGYFYNRKALLDALVPPQLKPSNQSQRAP